jgi:hypothetical protein
MATPFAFAINLAKFFQKSSKDCLRLFTSRLSNPEVPSNHDHTKIQIILSICADQIRQDQVANPRLFDHYFKGNAVYLAQIEDGILSDICRQTVRQSPADAYTH